MGEDHGSFAWSQAKQGWYVM